MSEEIALVDRYRGCLLGLACGDALGGPVEFMSRGDIAAKYPGGLREFVGGGWLHLFPGEITDDTQMTLALARSLVECGQLDMDDLARRFIAWYDTQPKDIGNTTRSAIVNLARGVSWSEAGEQAARGGASAGNGSVMRCAPIALRYRSDRNLLRQASIDSARITHADPRCTWGAVALNQALVWLLNGGSAVQVVEVAAEGIEDDETRRRILGAAERAIDNVIAGGFALDTLSAALWCLHQFDSFEEIVVGAVALGDDTDTTGAVAGALAGALFGVDAIPDRWREDVQYRDEFDPLARSLFGLSESLDG